MRIGQVLVLCQNISCRVLGFLGVLFLMQSNLAAAEDRLALVIGNGGYVHVPPLTNPPNDARLAAETLKSDGFKLVGDSALVNADRASMERAIRDFGKRLRGGAIGLFYYAGHGVQIDGENYLVPVGANVESAADVKYELITVGYVLDEMKNAGNRLNIVILDACRNNPFGGRGLRAVNSGLATMQAPEGTLISYATQPGNVASDGAGKDSPFTVALIAAMSKPGMGVFETFNEIGLDVKKATGGQQQPWLASSPIAGAFQFRPGAGAPAAAVSAAPSASANTAPGAAEDRAFWESVRDSKSSAEYQAYLQRFPQGIYASLARSRLDALKSSGSAELVSRRSANAAAAGSAAKLTPGGPYPGWGTTSLVPGVVGTGTVTVNVDGSIDTLATTGDRTHAVLNISDPNNVTGTSVAHLGVMNGVQRRYPDGSTSTQVTLQGRLANGKITGTYSDKYQTGQFEWTVEAGK
jgi:uncharacterized caspase-like protein